MMRKKDVAIPEVTRHPQEHIITQEREYKLITPLFGGGAIKGERDEVTVVRGTEVRGMLRFWWRACYGGRYDTVKKMKEAEDRIWGAAAKAKKNGKGQESEGETQEEDKNTEATVKIIVEPINKIGIREIQLYKIVKDKKGNNQAQPTSNALGYAAFPLQPSREELNASDSPQVKPVFDNVHFRLSISFPAAKRADIEGALWAWETFGGIGARTRRGFGALQLVKICGIDNTDLPTGSNVLQWIRDHIVELQTTSKPPVKGKAPGNVPCLLPEMKKQFIGPSDNALKAWENAIERLMTYRQYDNGRPQKYGRSTWPEAETILTFTHKKESDPSFQVPEKFPRAAFGLPIIFNFIGYSDLQKRPLQGASKNHERLASPLILRPLMCKKDKNKKDVVIGLAIVLENFSFPPEGIVFVEKNGKTHSANPYIEENDLKMIEPLRETDVLSDFMKYF